MSVREDTEKKVFAYMEKHHMIVPHDRIVAGVSGGADSVCMLFLLLEYARKVPLTLAVVHVNHGIRENAGVDAAFVESLCKEYRIPFFLTRADVRKLASEEKRSEEEMGRRIRYDAFRRAAEELGGAVTAVAHNSNDNGETMLFHLFRGSGFGGLGGIWPVRQGAYGKMIRPILCLERSEVEAYLTVRQISWCMDETNNGDDYCRNRIRHNILPYAEREISQGAVRHMCRTAEMLQETEAYLEQQTRQALEQCLVQNKGTGAKYVFETEIFRTFHEVIQKRMIFSVLKRISPESKDIFLVHVQDTLSLVTKEGNHSINLPFGIVARREYGRVIIEQPPSDREGGEIWNGNPVMLPSWTEMMEAPYLCDVGNGEQLEFRIIFGKKAQKVPENRYTKWFDYDKIEEPLMIRARRTGDFFTIAAGTGHMAHKSLKEYMIAEKIPKQLREKIPVISSGSHIVWLVGWRISEYFKVDENTKRILQVKLLQDVENANVENTKNGG